MRWRWRSGGSFFASGFIAAILVIVALCAPAFAEWSTGPLQQAQVVSTGNLLAPTGAAATNGICVAKTSWHLNVIWTATTSTIADGYEIMRSTTAGGPYTAVGTVNGRTTTTFVDTSPAANTTYFYVVRAKRNLWRSVNSNQATVTTLRMNCN